MFYIAKLFINTNDTLQPIQNVEICDPKDAYDTYSEAYKDFQAICSGKIYHTYFNGVTDYSVDIFNDEYYRIHLIINADSYFDCEDILTVWALDYLNDILKEHWLEDRMKDLPVWYAAIGKEIPSEDLIDILHIEPIERETIPLYEVAGMIEGDYEYIPTKLSNIVAARKYTHINEQTVLYYSLIVQAKNEKNATRVCKDFIRLYANEYE